MRYKWKNICKCGAETRGLLLRCLKLVANTDNGDRCGEDLHSMYSMEYNNVLANFVEPFEKFDFKWSSQHWNWVVWGRGHPSICIYLLSRIRCVPSWCGYIKWHGSNLSYWSFNWGSNTDNASGAWSTLYDLHKYLNAKFSTDTWNGMKVTWNIAFFFNRLATVVLGVFLWYIPLPKFWVKCGYVQRYRSNRALQLRVLRTRVSLFDL